MFYRLLVADIGFIFLNIAAQAMAWLHLARSVPVILNIGHPYSVPSFFLYIEWFAISGLFSCSGFATRNLFSCPWL